MRTWFRNVGARRHLAGASVLVWAAVAGCVSDKPAIKTPARVNPAVNYNQPTGQQGAANQTGVAPSAGAGQGAFNRTSGSISDSSQRIGLSSGALGAQNNVNSPPQFNSSQSNMAGSANSGLQPIATSNTRTAIQPVNASGSALNVAAGQPQLDPTPGSPPNPTPVLMNSGDREIRQPTFQRPSPPRMEPADQSIQPLGGQTTWK